MKRVQFKKSGDIDRRVKRNKRKGDRLKLIVNILVYALIIGALTFNTLGLRQLTTANQDAILSRQVEINADMINNLENDVLRHGSLIGELTANPKDLMEANVMVFTGKTKGSGSIIRVEKEYSYILTAAHVVSTTKVTRDKDNKLGRVTTVDEDITIHYGKDFKQKVRATVKKIDQDLDIAVLKVYRNLKVTPVAIANVEPELGDIVWSISNPGNHEAVINKGIFSDIEKDYAYVALGGFYGSSGGMCVNSKGEQIGVISTVVIARIGGFFPSLTIFNGITRTNNLNDFLKGLI